MKDPYYRPKQALNKIDKGGQFRRTFPKVPHNEQTKEKEHSP